MLRRGSFYWLALFFALHGAFLRAFIPAGYMPAQTAQGLRLAFCTPSGAQLTLEGAVLEHRAQSGDDCAFALALSTAAPSTASGFATDRSPAAIIAAANSPAVSFIGHAYRARGPPVLV